MDTLTPKINYNVERDYCNTGNISIDNVVQTCTKQCKSAILVNSRDTIDDDHHHLVNIVDLYIKYKEENMRYKVYTAKIETNYVEALKALKKTTIQLKELQLSVSSVSVDRPEDLCIQENIHN